MWLKHEQSYTPYLLRAAAFAHLVGNLCADQVLPDFNHCAFPLECLFCVGYLFFLLFAVTECGGRRVEGESYKEKELETAFTPPRLPWGTARDLLFLTEETK